MRTIIFTFIFRAGALFFLAFALSAQTLHAQCGIPTWVLANDCGDIQAFGGLAPNQPTIFCAGQIVNVDNNSSPAGEITATYIDWDDGICESFPGMPANLSHVYTFPTDTCYNGGLITFTVRMGVEKNCGTGNSFNFITFPVAVRFKPLVIITASDSSACTGSEISFSSAVCANGVVAYQWVIGGDTITSPDVPGYIFDNPGMYNVALTVTNACGQGGTAISITSAGPAAAIAAASANNVCAPDTVFFSNSSVNAASQSWTITPGTGWAFVNGTDSLPDSLLNQPFPLFFQVGTGDCLVQDTLMMQINGQAVLAGPDRSLCLNAARITLGATPASGTWTGNGVTPAGIFDPASAGIGQHALVYAVMNAAGTCVSTDTVTATVLALPEAALDSIDNLCVGAAFDFSAVYSGVGVSTCRWDFGDGSTSDACLTIHTYPAAGKYTIRLMVENTAGCRDTVISSLNVLPPPTAAFTTDQTAGCADLTVAIANQVGANGAQYVWDFGNGQLDTTDQPDPVVFGTGWYDTTYTIVLRAVSACGTATQEQQITVHPLPQANFGTDFSNGCSPMEVNFSSTTVGEPDFFNWYINGVAAGTGAQLPQQVFYAYAQDSTYVVALVAGNACGQDTITQPVLVKTNSVQAFFNTDNRSGCQPFAVQLIDYSTIGTSISWDLGDGNVATGDTVNHVYVQPGQYPIRAFATNGCGFDTTAVTITVLPRPVVSFEHALFGCQGDTLQLTNTSPNLAGSIWNFGDGTLDSTRTSPGHVYADTGLYTITLIGTSVTHACTASVSHTVEVKPLPTPSAMVLDSFGCQPFVFRALNTSGGTGFYVWNFGDGEFSTQNAPTHTYVLAGAYTVRLEMTDLFGCSNTWAYAPVNVYPKPLAQFRYDKTDLCTTPAVIPFENQSVDADSYVWDFGPFGGSLLTNPTISVPDRTTIRVGLMAENAYGCRDTAEQEILVYTAPVLDFGIEDARGCSPLAVLFENASLGVNRYAWDFGDGSRAEEAEPLHVFEKPGLYTVTLYASADSVCFDSLRFDNLVQVLVSPTAAFSYEEVTDTTVNPNGIIRFFDASAYTTSWRWDFGDGDSSRLQNPVHRYGVNGPKMVTLIAANGTGCTDTAAVAIIPALFGSLYIPNALSPDAGDPGSRYFQPRGAGLEAFEISIFTSNGQRVWHSTKLENGMPVEYWDGTFEGTPVPQGLYWWKGRGRYVNGRLWEGMSYDGSPGQTEGKVMLLR